MPSNHENVSDPKSGPIVIPRSDHDHSGGNKCLVDGIRKPHRVMDGQMRPLPKLPKPDHVRMAHQLAGEADLGVCPECGVRVL